MVSSSEDAYYWFSYGLKVKASFENVLLTNIINNTFNCNLIKLLANRKSIERRRV